MFVFGGARGGVNEVSVRIDEAGQDDATQEIEFAGATGFGEAFDAAARAEGGDASFADQKRGVGDDGGIVELAAATRRGAAKREELGTVGEEQGTLRAGLGHVRFGCHGTEIRKRVQVVR